VEDVALIRRVFVLSEKWVISFYSNASTLNSVKLRKKCYALQGLWGRSYEKVKCFWWHKQFKDLLENVEGDSGNALISMVFFTFNSFHKTKL
jgi:hypothetical protein